ncbi:MAG: hypothetical protein H8M99_12630 [Gloeobacteraceae cyanobacterium ES-bin-144]|nr:hypothetical protein [Verrucomicrobiales bacterium]
MGGAEAFWSSRKATRGQRNAMSCNVAEGMGEVIVGADPPSQMPVFGKEANDWIDSRCPTGIPGNNNGDMVRGGEFASEWKRSFFNPALRHSTPL